MSKRRRSALIASSASVIAAKTMYKDSLKKAGYKKLRTEVEQDTSARRKPKRGGAFYRRRYYACLAENEIVIGTGTKTETTNGANITKLTGQFKKIKSMKQLTTAFNAIQSYQPKDIHEKIVQRIYLYILEMHADRQWMFSKESIKTYSEADYQYKFWSYIFEQYLGRKQDVMLRWGDTVSESCKKIGKKFKLDLRLVLTPEEDTDLDNCTGEMAKKATVKKIYKDKLKSTVATKCHLNSFVRAVPHIQVRELPSVKMPILQVAGFQGQLSFIYLSKKKEYTLQEAASFSFPQSLKQIRGGAIESLIDSLAAIEEMVDNLRKVYHDYTSSTTNDISSILSQTSRQSKPTHLNSWLTKVVFEKEDDDSSSSDEDDDEEEEDEGADDGDEEEEEEEDQEEDDDDDEEEEVE